MPYPTGYFDPENIRIRLLGLHAMRQLERLERQARIYYKVDA